MTHSSMSITDQGPPRLKAQDRCAAISLTRMQRNPPPLAGMGGERGC